MPRPHALLSVFAVLILAAGCNPQGGKPPEPKLDTDDSKAIYALGLLIAERIEQFNLSESELDTFAAGVRDGVHEEREEGRSEDPLQGAAGLLEEPPDARPPTRRRPSPRPTSRKMAAEPGATKAPSGYIIKTVTEGTGPSPKATDTVKVQYHGTLRDGTVFDSSRERGEPAVFPLNGVIPCWTESVQTMKVGGKYIVTCPAEIAYGDRGAPPSIKPGAALTFEVELLEIEPPQAAAPPAPAPEKPAAKKK